MSALLVVHSRPPDMPALCDLAELAVLSLGSPASRRNYARSIRLFLASGRPLDRSGVLAYLQTLEQAKVGPVTRNIALAAIKLLAREAHIRGDLPEATLAAIERVKSTRVLGERAGNWLTVEQVIALLDQASWGINGIRNQAIVACLVGCGLRRSEVAYLQWEQWQQREGRWCWVDVVGKGGRVRTVPVPRWSAEYIERWREATECGT